MYKFKLELIPEEGVVSPYIEPYGYIFRALLMTWLKDLEPKLVHTLHSYNNIRPYSIKISYRNDELIFYLNVFDSDMAKTLIDDLIGKKENSFLISSQKFLLKKVLFEKFSIEDFERKAKNVKKFKIDFLEPTYFNTSRSKNVIRLPIPELVFSNLVKLWNKLSEDPIKIDKKTFLEWIGINVYLSSLKIRSKAKEMGETIPAVGFIGWVIFEINNNSHYTKYIDTLCRFGELTNLGGNRTAGLGVINYTPTEYFNRKTEKDVDI